MAMRLHELHPTIVHFPLALLPASLTLDLAGKLSGNRGLMQSGRYLAAGAVASTAAAGIAGLVAQQIVRTDGAAHDTLVTHRNLNLALFGITSALVAARMRRERPGWGYLAAGLAGYAAMNYTAYLGGRMVYTHGVGVEAAGRAQPTDSIELRRDTIGRALQMSVRHIAQGVARVFRELSHGEFAPLLNRRHLHPQAIEHRRARPDGAHDGRGTEEHPSSRESEDATLTGYRGTRSGYGSSSFYPGR
jgi:uncharacterized membrane protein